MLEMDILASMHCQMAQESEPQNSPSSEAPEFS
jgi:hypothetical protein